MRTKRRMPKKLLILIPIIVIIAGITIYLVGLMVSSTSSKSTSRQSVSQTVVKASNFNKQLNSIDEASSLWVVVNKLRPLNPIKYEPANLVAPNIPLRLGSGSPEMMVRSDTAAALTTMVAAAKLNGIKLMLASGYRSYATQFSLYNGYVAKQGQATADIQSARPGHSEHQTGLAADIEPVSRQCEIDQCFASLPEGKWLAANAYKYGFIIRYTSTKQAITGYENEPWHVRYIGTALSNEMHNTGITTLEEFFSLPAAPHY